MPFQPSHRCQQFMPLPRRSLEAGGFDNVYVLARLKWKTEISMHTLSSRTTRYAPRPATAPHSLRLGDLLAGLAFAAAIAFASAIIFGMV